jgi:tRNA-(ms[2]io[6]A)-hydroxylase
MLRLASDSSPTWLAAALDDVGTVLLDHAHCEKKAASTALNLIFRYPDVPGLVEALSPLAREELEHLELVVQLLRERDLRFQHLQPSTYAALLMQAVRRGEPDRLIDTLLCCALIEARSCERMKLLAEALPDQELAAFYRGLLASEARHHNLYVDLASRLSDRTTAHARLTELAAHEARVLVEQEGPLRMHSA